MAEATPPAKPAPTLVYSGPDMREAAEDEEAVHPVADEMIEEPSQPREVQILVGLHRGGHRWDDPVKLHDQVSEEGDLPALGRCARGRARQM